MATIPVIAVIVLALVALVVVAAWSALVTAIGVLAYRLGRAYQQDRSACRCTRRGPAGEDESRECR